MAGCCGFSDSILHIFHSEKVYSRFASLANWPKRHQTTRAPNSHSGVGPSAAPSYTFHSHPNIPLFSIENKRPPSNHPFSPSYNKTGMKLSSIQPPPPPYAPPIWKIPNEPIFPPIPNKPQPLTLSAANPNRLTETRPPVTIRANRRRAAWPPKALLLCESC